MSATQTFVPAAPFATWRDLVMPKEHGSWSLAFEPLALGLLCAPTQAGGWLGVAVAGAFFCRRPLRTALREQRDERRRAAWGALASCAAIAGAAFAVAVITGGVNWLPWLVPSAALGALFLYYDLKNDGREEIAELAGTAAFALLPAAWAALAGWPVVSAPALALIMCGRAVPTVIFVRAVVRGRKAGHFDFRLAILSAALALATSATLALAGAAPRLCVVLLGLFLARVFAIGRRPELRPKTLGIIEAVAGVAFVLTTALAWRL